MIHERLLKAGNIGKILKQKLVVDLNATQLRID